MFRWLTNHLVILSNSIMVWLNIKGLSKSHVCLHFQLNRVKLVEKEKNALEGEKNKAVEFLTLENDMFKKRSQLCQFYM